MPFKRGTSDETTESNFHEFRHGDRYAKVRRKHGKKKAHQMMIAAVLENRRRSALKKSLEDGNLLLPPLDVVELIDLSIEMGEYDVGEIL